MPAKLHPVVFHMRYTKLSNGCWQWTGPMLPNGYGQHGRQTYAHRLAYALAKGAIPTGLEIDHLCRNRACVNPDHLEAVTPRENQRRGFGVSGINARKAACFAGHPFLPGSYYVTSLGHRRCKLCFSLWRKQQRRKRVA